MSSSAAAQIMRQADAVKNTMTESGKAFSELWVTRQKLEDLYKRMLLLDLEYALDKKVEQDLWNHAFKNQINTLQTQAKDRQNPKKAEAQASLNLFLETASGFYLQFLQMICSTFKLDLPFRRRSAAFGIMRENTMNYKNIVTPKKSSCLYICCHCLVHLGDIARYRQQTEQAQTYYRHAANLSPNNGQPYNQLAILEASRGDKLSTVFYYVRSLAVRHPFPVAATNLEKFYSKLIKDTRSDFEGANLTMSEIITAFLQFQALLHMATGLDRASNLKTKITTGLGGHIRSQTVSAAHLTGIVAVSVFALHRARCDTNNAGESVRKMVLSTDEERCVQIHLSFAAKLLETMLQHTPKEDNKARDFLTLSAIKVLFDWLNLNKDVLQRREFMNSSIWSDLCKLLNTIQWLLNDSNKAADLAKYEDTPLPEDTDLRCFQPLEPSYSSYNFNKALNEDLSPACERDLRCQRLVAHGRWLAQDLPKLKLVIYQATKSIRNQFSTQKVAQNTESHQPSPKPSQRQNVALQTIMKKQMQRKMEQEKGSTSPLSVISEEGKSQSSDISPQLGSVEQVTTTSGAAAAAIQKVGGAPRQAGVISLHHKGGNQKNLPPRLSAKAAGSQNSNLSPRLQKKQAGRGNSASAVVQSGKGEGSDASKDDGKDVSILGEPEAYPSLSIDNYPALVSQRANAALIPQDNSSQSSGGGFLTSPNWGVFSMGRESSNSSSLRAASPMLAVPGPSSPSIDNTSGSSRSPQPSPRMVSPFSDQSMRSLDQSTASSDFDPTVVGGGLNFPTTNLTADFLSAIRSANQLIQQQQQQQSFHPLQQQQMLLGDKAQQPPFQDQPQFGPGQMNRMLGQQHQQQHQLLPPHLQQSSQQSVRAVQSHYSSQPGMGNLGGFKQPHGQLAQSGNMSAPVGNMPAQARNAVSHGQNMPAPSGKIPPQAGAGVGHNQNPLVQNVNPLLTQTMKMKVQPQAALGSLNMPPPPQRGLAQPPHSSLMDNRGQSSSAPSGMGYQASRMTSGAQSYLTKSPGAVAFIPPAGMVATPKGHGSNLGNPGFSATVLPGGPVGAGRAGGPGSQPAASMAGPGFMSGQSQHPHHQQQLHQQTPQQQQQQQQQPQQHGIAAGGGGGKPQQSGLLYQNIPLPGNAGGGGGRNTNAGAGGGGGGPSGGSGGGLAASSAGLTGLFLSGQGQPQAGQTVNQLLSNQQAYARTHHGGSNVTANQDARLSSSFQGHAAGTPKPDKNANIAAQFLQQQSQQPPPVAGGKQALQSQQSMIRAVMDPPFLQASGEYTLFSTNSSPAWPTSLVKTTPAQLMKTTPATGSGPSASIATTQIVSPQVRSEAGGMWSSTGPSPLERLLEQQRSQRQADS